VSEIRIGVKTEEPKSKVHFQIIGKKTQGIGYRAHIASIAITSGIEYLYVENLPKSKARKLEKVAVYAGSIEKNEKLKKFYDRITQSIPEEAIDVKITPMRPYHSLITIPPVRDFFALLTAGQLSKGIKYIEDSGNQSKEGFSNLQTGVRKLDEDLNKGFQNVVKALKSRKTIS